MNIKKKKKYIYIKKIKNKKLSPLRKTNNNDNEI